jgi:PII-like signaling protein
MKIEGHALRLTIYIGESDQYEHRPLYDEIVQRARRAGLAGATVLRGIEGFGASSVLRTTRLLSLSEDLPIVIVLVDRPDRIEAFLPELDELICEGLVVREEVEIIAYRGRGGDA